MRNLKMYLFVTLAGMMVIGIAELIPNAQRFALPDGGHLLLGHGAEIQAEGTRFQRSNMAALESSR